jgi:hypothetical protein
MITTSIITVKLRCKCIQTIVHIIGGKGQQPHCTTLLLCNSQPSGPAAVVGCTHAGGLIDACTQAASGVLTPGQARLVLNQQLEYVVCILVIGGIASGFRAYLFNAAAERVMCRLRVQLFSKVCQRITAHVLVDLTTTNC